MNGDPLMPGPNNRYAIVYHTCTTYKMDAFLVIHCQMDNNEMGELPHLRPYVFTIIVDKNGKTCINLLELAAL